MTWKYIRELCVCGFKIHSLQKRYPPKGFKNKISEWMIHIHLVFFNYSVLFLLPCCPTLATKSQPKLEYTWKLQCSAFQVQPLRISPNTTFFCGPNLVMKLSTCSKRLGWDRHSEYKLSEMKESISASLEFNSTNLSTSTEEFQAEGPEGSCWIGTAELWSQQRLGLVS